MCRTGSYKVNFPKKSQGNVVAEQTLTSVLKNAKYI